MYEEIDMLKQKASNASKKYYGILERISHNQNHLLPLENSKKLKIFTSSCNKTLRKDHKF